MAGATDTAERGAYASGVAAVGDVVLAAGYAVVAGAAILVGAVAGPARVLVAAPLLGFFPGYALVAVLFPARGVADADPVPTRWVRGPTWIERLSLSIGTSLVVLVLTAIVLSALAVPFGVVQLTTAVVAVTVAGSLLGLVRRHRLPADDRLVVPVSTVVADLRAGTVDARPLDAALNVALAVAVVVAASSLAFGLAAPDRGEAYTEVALLTEDDDRLVASNYTAAVERGDAANVTLTVENNEGEPTDYTAVVVLERLDASGGDAVVLEREELDRVSLSAADGETARQQLSVRPTMLGDDLRLNVFVYEGDAPATATADSAPHHLYLWLDVEQPGGATERVAEPTREHRSAGA